MALSTPSVSPYSAPLTTGAMSAVSPEETNFLRFVNLILKRAPRAVRVYFDTVHPPGSLVADLASERTTLANLKARKVINQVQWDTLFGVNPPLSKNFDVTLLICLLRNINPTTPSPASGFDTLPIPADVSVGADLARIKFYRNKVAHSNDARMNIIEFTACWSDVQGAIGRLGGSALLNDTIALRVAPIDDSERELLLEYLLETKQRRLERLETVPWNVRELFEEKLESWAEEDQVFVDTKASTAVEKFIKEHPCVVVVGHPGSGKSAIIHHIALKMGKEGFSIIPINRPHDITAYHNRNNPQVFVVDDPCGEYSVNEQVNEWAKYSEDIKKCLNFKQRVGQVQSKLLVSCRLVLSSAHAFRRIKVFSNSLLSLQNQDYHLSYIEKKQILEAHVKCELHFPTRVFEKHIDCFPLLCKLYVNVWADPERLVSFFDNPFVQVVSKLDLMIDDPKPETIYEYCALVCCSLAEHKLASYILNDEQTEDFECLQQIHNTCEIDFNPSELLSALKRQVGKYVKQIGQTFSVMHSKLLDIIVWHFGKQSPETLIQFSGLEIFQNRLRPLGRLEDDDNQDLFFVKLDENMLKIYCKRIQKDISQGLVSEVFKNPCMPNARIETCLFDLLVDGNVLNEMLLKTSCNLPSSNIEAYTSFSRENLLGNSRVTFLHLTIAYSWATFLEKLFESRNDVLLELMFGQRASTLHLAIISENILIVKRCFQYYADVFSSIAEFMDWGIQYDTYCLFCDTNPVNSSHKYHCPVTRIPIPLLVCITGKLEILEYLIKNKVCSPDYFLSEYQLFDEVVSPLMLNSLYGHTSIVRYLLQNGASANYQNEEGISALHEACQRRHVEIIQLLLSFGADVNIKDGDGETPISLACRNYFIEIVEQLLRDGADVNQQDSLGLTPIHLSISLEHIKTVQLLIENECDTNIVSKDGDTPLSLACFQGNCDILKLLLQKGANRQQLQNGLLKACKKGNKNIVSLLIHHGAEVNYKDTKGYSALHVSCINHHSDLVSYLFTKGAYPDILSDDKQTPLQCASKHLSVMCVTVLLKNKAEINAIDDKGRTALHYALETTHYERYVSKEVDKIEHGGMNDIFHGSTLAEEIPASRLKTQSVHFPVNIKSEKFIHAYQEVLRKLENVIDILIKNKINLNAIDTNDCSPLHFACSLNFLEVVKTLIHNEANVNSADKSGCTPLHIACVKGHPLTVKLLVENGGNINASDLQGFTPLHLACFRGHIQVVTTLVQSGANINIPDKTGSTSLHIAVKNRHRNILCFLISNGAIMNVKDENGFTPLILCGGYNDMNVIEVLLTSGADINEESSEGLNVVTMAIKNGNFDIADELYNRGAHLHENNYRYLLQSIRNKGDIFRFLGRYNRVINDYRNEKGLSLLHLATLDNNESWVDSLLNQTELFDTLDNEGQNALYYAIDKEFYYIIQLLQRKDISDAAMNYVLKKVCNEGKTVIVEKLIQIPDFDALKLIYDGEHYNIIRNLMRNVGVGYRMFSDYEIFAGDKIITDALNSLKYFKVYNIILAELPDELWIFHKSLIPCLCPKRGETSPLNWKKQAKALDLPYAFEYQNISGFEIWPLLFTRRYIHKIMHWKTYDPDVFSSTDVIGNTFLHYVSLMADELRIENFLSILRRHCSVNKLVNQQNLAGCTPLHYAIRSPRQISCLIELGADVKIKDIAGHDALHYAISGNFEDTKIILESSLTE